MFANRRYTVYVLLLWSFITLPTTTKSTNEVLNGPNINEYLFRDNRFQFVDLTLRLNSQLKKLSDEERVRVLANLNYNHYNHFSEFCENDWIGTSLDLTLRPTGPDIVQPINYDAPNVPLNHVVLPLIIADISSRVNGDANFILQKYHLDYFLNNYFGKTEQPCIIIFKFGWSKYKGDAHKYFGLANGNVSLNFPGISDEVAGWITKAYKNIVGVVVDLPSVGPGSDITNAAHNILVGSGVYVLENVDLHQHLPDALCTALVLPQKDSVARAPVRLVAVCPKDRMEPHQTPWHRM